MRIMEYKRRDVQKAIVLALRNLGGTASRKDIKKKLLRVKLMVWTMIRFTFVKRLRMDPIVHFYLTLILA